MFKYLKTLFKLMMILIVSACSSSSEKQNIDYQLNDFTFDFPDDEGSDSNGPLALGNEVFSLRSVTVLSKDDRGVKSAFYSFVFKDDEGRKKAGNCLNEAGDLKGASIGYILPFSVVFSGGVDSPEFKEPIDLEFNSVSRSSCVFSYSYINLKDEKNLFSMSAKSMEASSFSAQFDLTGKNFDFAARNGSAKTIELFWKEQQNGSSANVLLKAEYILSKESLIGGFFEESSSRRNFNQK